MKTFKWIRVAVAACMFTLVTLFFLGLGGGCGLLEKIQVGPALIGIALLPSLLVFLGWLFVTWLFGRVYCSMVCPLGILQDVLGRIVKLVRPKRRFVPHAGWNGFRVAALVAFVLLLVAQMASFASLIEPYGIFGRIAAQVFQPIAEWGNNLLADWLGTDGPVVIFKREVLVRSVSGFAVAMSSFALLLGLVAWKGRVFCNLLCPMGTILWVPATKSVFQLAIDANKCVKCGLCSGVCKAECLDGKAQMLDNARCVRCFNCIGACAKGAISLRPAWKLPKKEKKVEGRREVVLGLAKTAGGIAAAGVLVGGRKVLGDGTSAEPITPPGSMIELLREKCVACGLCVAKCPRKVIAPAGFSEYGPLGFMMPKMDFSRGFCDPACTICSEVCPTGAIHIADPAAKKWVKIGLARFDRATCLACTEKIPCGLCERRCPQKAITLKEEEAKDDGGKTVKVHVPAVDAAKCTGCGACENYCPSHAMRVVPLARGQV